MKSAKDKEYGQNLQKFYHKYPELVEEALTTYFLNCKMQQAQSFIEWRYKVKALKQKKPFVG
jgi:hypothetical protein